MNRHDHAHVKKLINQDFSKSATATVIAYADDAIMTREFNRYKVMYRYEVRRLRNPSTWKTESEDVFARTPREAVENVKLLKADMPSLGIVCVWEEDDGVWVALNRVAWDN